MTDVTVKVPQDLVEQIVTCVNVRIGVIETGVPLLTANDAIAQGQHKLVRSLDEEQKRLIASLSSFRDDLLRESSQPVLHPWTRRVRPQPKP